MLLSAGVVYSLAESKEKSTLEGVGYGKPGIDQWRPWP